MKISKESIEQSAITATITLIVAMVGAIMFSIDVAVFSGIAAGLSVTVGKEYGDSLVVESSWHWHDIIPAIAGVIVGLLIFVILYFIR